MFMHAGLRCPISALSRWDRWVGIAACNDSPSICPTVPHLFFTAVGQLEAASMHVVPPAPLVPPQNYETLWQRLRQSNLGFCKSLGADRAVIEFSPNRSPNRSWAMAAVPRFTSK